MSLDAVLRWALSLNGPCEATSGLPTCPYARRAFDDGRVSIVFKTAFNGLTDVRHIVETWTDHNDVVLLVVDRNSSSAQAAAEIANEINDSCELTDLVVMADHPDQPFVVSGHSNSQGDYLIFFVQRRSRLRDASKALQATGYYRNWPDEQSDHAKG